MRTKNKHFDIFFFLFLFLTLLALFLVFKPYINTLVAAVIYSALVFPFYNWLDGKKPNWPTKVKASIVVLLTIVVVIIPLSLIVYAAARQIIEFTESVETGGLGTLIKDFVFKSKDYIRGIELFSDPQFVDKLFDSINSKPVTTSAVIELTKNSFKMLINLLIFLFAIFTLVPNINKFTDYVIKISPLGKKITKMYIAKCKEITVGMIKGNFVVAIAQTILAVFFLWLIGVDYLFLLGAILFVLSFVPVLTTGMIFYPYGVYLLVTGDNWEGLVLILAQSFVIGMADDIIRSYIAAKESKVNPILMIVAILGGVSLWGVMGIFYGPIVLVLALTSVEVYKEIYGKF